jgi:hypothetical protein
MFVDFNILNQLGSPSINSNTFANRPAAGQTGRLFVSIDTFEIYRDNGTTWDLIGGPGSSTVTGTGAATQVAYWTAAQSIGGSNNLWWDNTNGFLGVGSAVPSARIEAVKTDGIGIYANYTTNASTGSSATAIWAKNITNSSGYGAVIEETTPNNTGGQYPLLIKHSLSTGTAAVGMGTGVHWQLPDDAGTFKTTQLTVETTDAAAATYSTRYRFNVQSNGSSTPVAYINATGLGLFTATPGAALDIHSTGIMAQLNSTSATANSLLAFQRSGSGLWRIGDAYNGGNNYFELHNTVLTNNAIEVLAASNEATFLSGKTYSTGNAIGIAVQHNLTIPNGVNVGLAALGGVNSNLNLTLQGSTTVANTGRQGLEGSTSISFTGAGTLTMTQGSTIRAFSALSSVYAFNGSAVGTITHLAGLRICFPDNVGSAVNITNNYALLINNQTTGTGTVTYTNRWGIYQEGASDLNYFAANTLIGSTVNNGDKLQVTGTASISGALTANNYVATGGNNTTILNSSAATTGWVQIAMNNTSGSALLGIESSVAGTLSTGSIAYATILRNYTNTDLQIATNNIVRATFDTIGNLGIGVTLSSWGYGGNIEMIGAGRYITSKSDDNRFAANVYNDGNNENYASNGFATRYRQANGIHSWSTAASGTAGNTITFTQAMTLDDSGNLSVGTTNNSLYGLTFGRQITFSNATASSYSNLTIAGGSGASGGIDFGNQTIRQAGIYGLNGSDLALYTNGTNSGNGITDRLTIKSNGNVLIGTTTDAGQKLQVNGTAKFDGDFTISTSSETSLFLANSSANSFRAISKNNGKYVIQHTGILDLTLLDTSGNLEIVGSMKTAAPAGGTQGAWKLGSRVAAAVALDATQYIELEVGGTLYKLAIVT